MEMIQQILQDHEERILRLERKRKGALTPDEVRHIRESAGMSLAQAAERAGVSRSAWAQWEGGQRPVPKARVEDVRKVGWK